MQNTQVNYIFNVVVIFVILIIGSFTTPIHISPIRQSSNIRQFPIDEMRKNNQYIFNNSSLNYSYLYFDLPYNNNYTFSVALFQNGYPNPSTSYFFANINQIKIQPLQNITSWHPNNESIPITMIFKTKENLTYNSTSVNETIFGFFDSTLFILPIFSIMIMNGKSINQTISNYNATTIPYFSFRKKLNQLEITKEDEVLRIRSIGDDYNFTSDYLIKSGELLKLRYDLSSGDRLNLTFLNLNPSTSNPYQKPKQNETSSQITIENDTTHNNIPNNTQEPLLKVTVRPIISFISFILMVIFIKKKRRNKRTNAHSIR